MKRVVLSALMVIFLIGLAYAGTIEKEFDIAKGNKLILDLETGGSVYISGWDKDKVGVKTHVSRIDSDAYDIDFDAGSSRIKITSDHRGSWLKRNNKSGGHFEFDLKVPSEFDIEIETMGGEVNVVDVKG